MESQAAPRLDAAAALSSCGDGNNGIGMSDGDSARQAHDQAQGLAQGQARTLRDHATSLLQEAAQCGDPARRDGLLRAAVARLNEARRLLDQLDDTSERLGSSHSMKGAH